MSTISEAVVGAVVIGRNEGARLVRCLESLRSQVEALIYVDSGSSDGSVAEAERLGATIVELAPDQPFTAARARNAGFERLLQIRPQVAFVQFVDGDCEVHDEWIARAAYEFESAAQGPPLAIVCGRRRERHPDASIYNRLCDLEWDTPVGDALYCGGDALVSRAAFEQVGGFNPTLIAGEEPELCVRLHLAGWRVRRIPSEMTLHDAGLTRFSQWWRRMLRSGHAYAEGAALHGRTPIRHFVRPVRTALLWAGLIPLTAVALAPSTRGFSFAVAVAAYFAQWLRIVRWAAARRWPAPHRVLYATFTQLGRFAELLGIGVYWLRRWRRRPATLIEYKSARA